MNATVIVSCYNQQKYISECLDSILSQEVDFEYNILISDDCSTDQTQEILRVYASRYPSKINLILRERNVGPAQNYVEAHDRANGDIVFHFDGDDIMYPGKLQAQFDQFKLNVNVTLCLHRANYFTDDHVCYPTGRLGNSDCDESVSFSMRDLALWGTIAVHSSYAYRRSSRTIRGLRREFMEWFFAIDSLQSGTGIYINKIFVGYRHNPNGASYLSTPRGKKKSYLLYFNDLQMYFKSLRGYRKELYANAVVTFIGMTFNGKCFDKNILLFLLRNIACLRPTLLKKSFEMRKSVRPALKVVRLS